MRPTGRRPHFVSDSAPFSRSRLKWLIAVLIVAPGLHTGCEEGAPAPFDGAGAWQYLVQQCDFGPRPPRSPGHEKTVRLIVEVLQNAGAKVTLQRFEVDDPYGDDPLPVTNVIGSFDPEKTRRVILAAHYDTRPWADQEKDKSLHTQPIIGANDGASGVAVLLQLAKMFSLRTPREIGVDLVFFDAEDYGREGDLEHYLIGSQYFAANLEGYRPECGILLDLVGAKDAVIRQEGYSLEMARTLCLELFGRAAQMQLPVFVAERNQAYYDDHVPLLRAGIPMVDLIGLPYPWWHTLGDTPDKCSEETLRQVGTLLADFVYRFSW